MGKITKPCFDCIGDDEGVITCFAYIPDEKNDNCTHLKKGGHWENCNQGRTSSYYPDFMKYENSAPNPPNTIPEIQAAVQKDRAVIQKQFDEYQKDRLEPFSSIGEITAHYETVLKTYDIILNCFLTPAIKGELPRIKE